jgi:hypothetical protein
MFVLYSMHFFLPFPTCQYFFGSFVALCTLMVDDLLLLFIYIGGVFPSRVGTFFCVTWVSSQEA